MEDWGSRPRRLCGRECGREGRIRGRARRSEGGLLYSGAWGGRRRERLRRARLIRVRFPFCYLLRAGGWNGEVPLRTEAAGGLPPFLGWGHRGLSPGLPPAGSQRLTTEVGCARPGAIPAPPAPHQRHGTGWEGMEEAPGPGGGKGPGAPGRAAAPRPRVAAARAWRTPSRLAPLGRVRPPLPTLRARYLPAAPLTCT